MSTKRPLNGHLVGALVFGLSVLSLGALEVVRSPEVTVPAVAHAHAVEHPAPADTTVARVHVRLGELVQAGSPLVTLDDAWLRGELERLDLNIFITIDEAQLVLTGVDDGAEQAADEQLTAELLRVRALRESPTGPAAEPTSTTEIRTEARARLYERRLQLLQSQRQELVARIAALEVTANDAGVVATILQLGASVTRGTSVARLLPERASEVVAYLPAETNPADVPIHGRVLIAQTSGNACAGEFAQHLGAEVARLPGSGDGLFGGATRGLPLHITLPPECELGVGQRVWVSLESE